MSFLRSASYPLRPHVRPSLTPTGCRAAIFSASHAGSPSERGRPVPYAAGRRGIHVGAFAGETIQATADTFSYVHANFGVPWYLAIPLLAVSVNATLRFPLQLYVAKLREKRRELNPLIAAWAKKHTQILSQKQPDLPERIARLRVAGAIEKSRRRINKAWGVQRFKGFAPLLGIIPFVTISEALRRKCGAPLGWISKSVGLSSPDSAVGSNLGAASSMFDPSLVEGGCLWFTDLTSADPYFGLPIICSGILFWNTWGRMPRENLRALLSLKPNEDQVSVMNRLQTVFGRTMLIIPLFPILFADLPSAIFLYWACSFGLASINEAILNRLVPRKEPKLVAENRPPSVLPYLKNRN